MRNSQALRPDGAGGLDLSDNDLGDAGCELLAQQGAALLGTLRRLNLSGNQVSSAGVAALARALAGSSLLQELNLSRNKIERLPNSLAALRHLEWLGLHENVALVSPPPHVVSAGTAAVLGFLARGWRLESRQLCPCCSRVFCERARCISPGGGVASACEALTSVQSGREASALEAPPLPVV